MHLFWSQLLLCSQDIHSPLCNNSNRLCPHVLTLRVYSVMTIELHRHDSEFPVLKDSSQCKVYPCSVWISFWVIITTTHSNTKSSPWKSERESFFFWIVSFMVCCLYVWMTSTRAVTCTSVVVNRLVSHSARHQRPARERHIMRIASRENVDKQRAAQYKFYTITRFSLLLNVDITILYPNTQTPTVNM